MSGPMNADEPFLRMRRQFLISLGLAACAQGCSQAKEPSQNTKKVEPIQFVEHEILMLVYPRFTALDLIGPQHVFSLLGPGYKTRLVWKDLDEIRSDTGVPVRPTLAFRDCPARPTILFVPGGTEGTLAALEDKDVRDFVARVGSEATYVTSVCTGALILGAAGLLKGYQATTHWLAMESLRQFGAEPVPKRVVTDRNRITGGGVTAGIDFAITLAARLKDESYAKGIQLMMEYAPQPPFNSGTPDVAEPETVKMLEAMVKPFLKDVDAALAQIKM